MDFKEMVNHFLKHKSLKLGLLSVEPPLHSNGSKQVLQFMNMDQNKSFGLIKLRRTKYKGPSSSLLSAEHVDQISGIHKSFAFRLLMEGSDYPLTSLSPCLLRIESSSSISHGENEKRDFREDKRSLNKGRMRQDRSQKEKRASQQHRGRKGIKKELKRRLEGN
uniref:Uncharacterized protein n=1 Tax=Cucumis melo TaxID=3656 RepID=A0A9I9DEV4_CUCME